MNKSKPTFPAKLLLCICAPYTAGICIYALFHPPIAVVLTIFILGLAFIKFKKLPYFLTALIVCASFSIGIVHFSAKEFSDRKFINQYAGRYLTISGKITDISFTDNNFQSITVDAHTLTCLDVTEKVDFSANIFTDCEKSFSIGDKVVFSDIFVPSKKASVHSFDAEKYLKSKGVFASFNPSTNHISVTDNSPDFLTKLRLFSLNLSSKLKNLVGGDQGGVASAITLGDSSGLSDRLSNLFRRCGVSHVVAVSGMHLSILIGFFFFLAARSRLHYKIRNILGIILVLLYMLLTGMSPSVTRAGIMIICVLSAAVLDRKEDAPTSFFLSAAIILAFNPYTIFSASFLLSYLALGGIILLSGHLSRIIGKLSFLPDFISTIAASSIAAWLFTLPVLAIMFGGISLVSLPANILILPFIQLIFGLSLTTLALSFIIPPLAPIVGFLIHFLIKTIVTCSEVIAAIPGSYVNLPQPGIIDIAAFIVFSLAVYLLVRGRKISKPMFAAICLAVCYTTFSFTYSATTWSVTYLDIGQGDCILIKAPGYKHYLIDTGPHSGTTISALRSCGVNRLEAIFLSHADKDHTGALSDILSQIPTGKVILPNRNIREKEVTTLVSLALSAGTDVEFSHRLCNYNFDGISVHTLWPRHSAAYGDENKNSLVMSVNIKGNKFLFTGDIDSGAENDIIKSGTYIDADVLKAAHHGSDSSSSDLFLQKVSPEYAVICAGNGNPYGHPHDDTLLRLENAGSQILRTDKMGDIKFTIDLFGNMRVHYETNR